MARWLIGFELSDETPERLEQLTQQLLTELREVGAVRVDRVRGAGPEGSKSGAALVLGQIALSGVFSAATATALAKIFVARIDQAKARRATIEKDGEKYEFDSLSREDQHRLVEAVAAKLRDDEPSNSQ